MKKHLFYWLALSFVVITGCQKETSFELGNTPAKGSLQSDVTGDCLPKTVNGVFMVSTALVPATNSITVSVNVTTTGTYLITTDTLNGYFFRGTGTFTTLGANTVTLRGNGTPFFARTDNFVVSFDGTICDIAVDVLPAGTGPAAFTLVAGGSPSNCASAVVSGTYLTSTALVPATNYVDIQVNVTQVGTYTITATGGGMTFTKTGAFVTATPQSVRLNGSGSAPATAGPVTVTFAPPLAPCSFIVNVVAPVTGTLGGAGGACTPITPTGTYTQGVVPPAGNTVQVQITTPSVGPYSVTTNTIGGLSFSASGTSTGATQMITLLNNGVAPTVSGPQTFTVTFGTSTCTFPITIAPAPSGPAYIADCSSAVVNGLYEEGTQLNCSNTVDIDVNVTGLGAFTITTVATGGMTFSLSGTFTSLGNQTITLVGSGTAGTAGLYNIPMPGTTPCTFPITVDPAPTVDWKFTVTNAPATTYRGQDDLSEIINPSPVGVGILLSYQGSNSFGDDFFNFGLNDFNGTIAIGETYSTSANPLTTNAAAFHYDKSGTGSCVDTYTADPTTVGVTMTFTVQTHNTTTHVITGIFSGTAKNLASGTMTITSGTFTSHY